MRAERAYGGAAAMNARLLADFVAKVAAQKL
jgi:hypothetical protein